jgi:protein translocase SecG subunit
MRNILIIAQIVLSVLIVLAVLVQNRGASLSGAFGGGGALIPHKKRGGEKFLHYTTVVLGSLFMANAVAILLWP